MLRRKLRRELWQSRGQVLAIALVFASGVGAYTGFGSALESLQLTQSRFYSDHRFADVFASLTRAPESLMERIRALPGVRQADSRVLAPATLELEGFVEPVSGLLVSLPPAEGLNQLYLRSGRLPGPGRDDEIAVSEFFAEAHGLVPGDGLNAVIDGRRRTLTVVGVALSPEFVYQIKPGEMFPDFKRYGVLWMDREPLANARDMDGAFNHLVLTLTPGASEKTTIAQLDRLLARYGGIGAIGREHQISHRYLTQEMHEIETLITTVPVIFIAVAAFLLNVVVSRLIRNQRDLIGVLKAFGYSGVTIGVHYVLFVLAIVAIGGALGVLVGLGIGRGISAIYTDFFRFPFLNYRMSPTVAGFALSVSAAATLVGTLAAVRGAALLPPAVAMRPEPPPAYRAALLERLGLQRYLDQPSRMIVRHLERQPVKSLLSVFGISLAVAVMMVTRFGNDSIRFMMDVQFGKAQREEITLTFLEPTESEALYSVRNLPGVHYTEAFRVVEVELVHGHRRYRTAIQGYPRGSVLHRVLNRELEPVPLPVGGVLLTDYIADRLQLEPGDTVTAEVLDDARPRLNLPVAGVVTQYVGASAYMRLEALNRALREGPVISGVLLTADAGANAALYAALRESPSVAGVALHDVAEQTFYETIGRVMGVFTAVGSLLASTIAFGIVYNSARIALSERSRELASLRVLGYSKGEVAYILLGELALLTLTALPLGFAAGLALCSWVSRQFASELYRVPLALGPATYALAASAVLVSAAISALLILRRVNRLDLIAVLKTRE